MTNHAPFNMHLERDSKGRITRKQEQVAGGEARKYAYRYDEGGRLAGVDTGYGEAETYEYDGQGRRIEAQLTEPEFHTVRLHYQDDRLVGLGNSLILHDDNGFRMYREQQHGSREHYHYAPDYRLLRVEKGHRIINFDHDENRLRVAKYIDGQLVEQYRWHDLVRMDGAVMHGVLVDFLYVRDDDRMPSLMMYGDDFYHLYYDQVGSLRVVADEDGNVIKEIVYDSFGRILEDTNPAMLIPLGFAGGLHDRDIGWVRFGYRDYDPLTARFTAKDPIGYAGGDNDLYGYCLDDPVNGVDPMGLKTAVHLYEGRVDHVGVDVGANGDPVGKYPKSDTDIFGGEGQYRKEERQPVDTLILDTTQDQEQAIKEYQQRALKSTSVRYNLFNNNCVEGADDMLKAGGLNNTPKTIDYTRPRSYFNELKNRSK